MKNRLLWLAGSAGIASAAAARFFRRKKGPEPVEGPDPRASELRQRLDEARELTSEREEFEAGETPVDTVEDRRRTVHEHGRDAIGEMRPPEQP
jgi:hypothetical protein